MHAEYSCSSTEISKLFAPKIRFGVIPPLCITNKKYDYFNSFVPAVQDLPGTSLD